MAWEIGKVCLVCAESKIIGSTDNIYARPPDRGPSRGLWKRGPINYCGAAG